MATVHFGLGADLGKRLTEIAQEKFIYNGDPEAAIKVFTESLCGFPEDMAIRCLTGKDLKLIVTGDEIQVVDTPVEDYPEIDIKYVVGCWVEEFDKLYKIFS